MQVARDAGLTVEVTVPIYDGVTWRGYTPGNQQIYMGWATPEDHPAIRTAVDVYDAVVAPHVATSSGGDGGTRAEARVDRWIFSTDGVGYPGPDRRHDDRRARVEGAGSRPADTSTRRCSGSGPGIEQNTHKIGECVDARELRLAIAFLAAIPQRVRRSVVTPRAGPGHSASGWWTDI